MAFSNSASPAYVHAGGLRKQKPHIDLPVCTRRMDTCPPPPSLQHSSGCAFAFGEMVKELKSHFSKLLQLAGSGVAIPEFEGTNLTAELSTQAALCLLVFRKCYLPPQTFPICKSYTLQWL